MNPQQKAIETIDRNVSLEASAGTGKTYVLTRRFVEILKRGHLPSGREVASILAITFTNKAAREMRERIAMLIEEEQTIDAAFPYTTKLLHQASIQTIHSFCHDQLKRYGNWIGVPSDFTVAEQWESDHWLWMATATVVRESEDFIKSLSDTVELYSEESWTELLTGLYRSVYLSDRVDLEQVLELTRAQWEQAARALPAKEALIRNLQNLQNKVNGRSKWKNLLTKEFLEALEATDLRSEEGATLLYAIASCDGTAKGCEEIIAQVQEQAGTYWLAKEAIYESEYQGLVEMLRRIHQTYTAMKMRHKKLDFSDLEEYMIELLDRPEICQALQDQFRYVMVDECQDTNERQRLIFEKLSTVEKPYDRQNLFVVGDPKQSIYRFRGASVDEYRKLCAGIEASGGLMLFMTVSYRFDAPVADYLNQVFSAQWPETYDPIQRPVEAIEESLFAPKVDAPPIMVLTVDREEEAERYAKVVHHMMNLYAQGVDWSKMALMGRTKQSLAPYLEQLRAKNIPYHSEIKSNLFARQEIWDLVFLVRLMDGGDPLAWAQFLRSPLGGLKDASVVKLVKEKPLADQTEQLLYEKALETVTLMRQAVGQKGIAFALKKALAVTGASEIGAYDQRALDNQEAFIAMVEQWETEHWGDTTKLCQTISLWQAAAIEETGGQSGGIDAVEVLTIHKSKGLEFDYVFLTELSEKEHTDYPKIVYHRHAGLAIRREQDRFYQANRQWEQKQAQEDAKTLLYVALSRAKKGLILGTLFTDGKTKMHEVVKESLPEVEVPAYAHLTEVLEPDQMWMASGLRQHSATSFMTYQRCPLEYYYRYVKKQEQENVGLGSGYGVALGNVMHHFAFAYEPGCDMEALLDHLLAEEGLLRQHQAGQKALDMARTWMAWAQGVHICARELPFAMMEGMDLITGVMDAVIEEDGQTVIVDYKTNAFTTPEEKEELVKRYKDQLYLYYDAYGKPETRLRILFLQDGSQVDLEPTEEELSRYRGLWQAYLRETTHREKEYYKQGQCHAYCPYVQCEFRTEGVT